MMDTQIWVVASVFQSKIQQGYNSSHKLAKMLHKVIFKFDKISASH